VSPSEPVAPNTASEIEETMFGFFKRRRRERLRSGPFPAAWIQIVEKNVPFYARLPEADRRELQGLIQIFLAEKYFEGCGGLELTDEIKVTIAAQACLLLLHRQTDVYPRLVTVLVYRSAYLVQRKTDRIGPGTILEGDAVHLGESWSSGVVVVSWDNVRARPADARRGQNLVLHEFAHQLDVEDGAANGAPVLDQLGQHTTWARVLNAEYERLRRETRLGRPTVLDEYGASDPAEFFAVATECFFEKPHVLRKRHPDLYDELKAFYRQDPARFTLRDPSPAER
jgi:MtfA peptidase